MPQRPGEGVAQAADRKAQQAMIATLGVGALGRGGALLVDLLGLLGAHAPAPGRDAGPIAGQRRVRVAAVVLGLGRRREDGDTGGGERLDVGERDEAAIGEVLGRAPAVGAGDLVSIRIDATNFVIAELSVPSGAMAKALRALKKLCRGFNGNPRCHARSRNAGQGCS